MKLSGMLLPLLVLLGGCISVSRTSTGDFGFEERFRKSTDAIIELSKEAEAKALKERATVRPEAEAYLRRHFTKADELVSARLEEVKRASGGFFDDYGRRRRVLLDFTLKQSASVDVIESQFANATAFPTGKVLVTRPLAEGFDVSKEGFDSVLLGVLLHEVIHVRDGHALEQWSTADGRSAWERDRVLSGLAAMTAVIPFFHVTYDVQYPFTFGAARQLPTLSEFAADLGAVALLDAYGFDSSRYIAFLSELSASPTPAGRGNDLLRKRVDCLGAFARTSYRQPLRGAVMGSQEEGDNLAWITFPDEEKVAELLASPELLAKEITSKGELSDARRRELLVGQMRKWMFTSCALRHAFPEAPVEDGVLKTPSFDVTILLQFQ